MAFWGLIPDLADRGVELHLIANPGEWNMSLDRWQWDSCGIWIAGPLPRPGKSITMMTHSRDGTMHPFALDRRTDNRGYPPSSYIKTYRVPVLEEFADEALLRELSNWMREHMEVYASHGGSTAQTKFSWTLHLHRGACRHKTKCFGEHSISELHLSAWRYSQPASFCDPVRLPWGRHGHWP